MDSLYRLEGTQQLFVPAVDIDFGKRWEFNFGVGVGATRSTDHLLIKCILGYRFLGAIAFDDNSGPHDEMYRHRAGLISLTGGGTGNLS